MSKRLIFLVSVALVLSLAGSASSATTTTTTTALINGYIPAAGAPTIDATKDGDDWSVSQEYRSMYTVSGEEPESSADVSTRWWALWDSDYLYVFVDVNDSDLRNDSGEGWQDDSVEFFFDINDDNPAEFGEDDYHYCVDWYNVPGDKKMTDRHAPRSFVGVEWAVLTKGGNNGYTLEIKFPWDTLDYYDTGIGLGVELGFEVQINDDDGGGSRDTKLGCFSSTDPWQDPSAFGTIKLVPGLKACNPIPRNYAEGVLSGLLQWSAGKHADDVSGHVVYFDTTKANVQARSGCDVNGVSRTEPNYSATLGPITTYYWAIDEVNEQGPSPFKWVGDVWQFTTAPLTAHSPDPCDGAKWIDYNADLVWGAGFYANKHNIYFGTVDPPPAKQMNYNSTTYDPGTLLGGTTYYWRINEVNDGGTPIWEGDVWSFTVINAGAGIKAEYYNNNNLEYDPPELTRIDYSLDFDWSYGRPDPCIGDSSSDSWSVRWTSELEVPTTDTYTISFLRSLQDGVRFWLDGQLIVDKWRDYNEPLEDSIVVDLNAGLVPLVIEFSDVWGPAIAKLSWECSTIPKEIIPRDQYYLPRRSVTPFPSGGATDISSTPILRWAPGMYATNHDLYFGTDKTKVTDANRTNQLDVLIKQDIDSNSAGTTYDIANDVNVGLLQFNTTYYWRIDDINMNTPPNFWTSSIWSFTTDGYHEVETFERYFNPAITDVWKKSGTTGATIDESTDTLFRQVHAGNEAMAYSYSNSASPFYSEAYAKSSGTNSLDFGKNWRLRDVKALSLWFQGRDFRGSFTGLDPYTIEADGVGIFNISEDYCYFVYRYVAGQRTGEVIAKVDSLDDTNPWAMAGVMIRQSLNSDSKYGAVVVTPGSGIVFTYRVSGQSAFTDSGFSVAAPYWVKIAYAGVPPAVTWTGSCAEPNEVTGYHDNKWNDFAHDQMVPSMGNNIYLGLCVTSRSYGEMCTAKISNVSVKSPPSTAKGDPDVGADIGKAYNNPEKMYVLLKDSAGHAAAIYYPGTTNPAEADPCVTMIGEWTEWRIDLNDFMDVGVDVCDVNNMYIGFGNRSAPVAGGSGMMFIDDIALYTAQFYEPECPPWPPDLARDGDIDNGDLGVMADNWLIEDYNVTPVAPPNEPNLVAWYRLEGNTFDFYGVHNGTPNGVKVSDYVGDCKEGDLALDLKGDANSVNTASYASAYGIDGNKPRTITVWAKARDFSNDAGLYEIGLQDYGREFGLRVTTEPNVWRAQHWGADRGYDIDFTYPSLNEWVHFGHSYDGTTVRVYADGYLVVERAIALDTATSGVSTRPFSIGWFGVEEDYYFDGIVDDVRIYNCALSQANIAYIAGKTSEYIQPLQWLLTPPNPDINLYVEDPNTNRNRINFKDLAELGNAWGDTQVWPIW